MSTLNLQGQIQLQGFLNFSYKIYGETTNWINNLNTYGLPLPSANVLNAVNNLLGGLYNNNLRSKIKRLNLFCGGDWRGSLFPLITDLGNPVWDYNGVKGATFSDLITGPFQAGDWSLVNGFDPKSNTSITGTTQSANGMYLDTGVLANLSNFTGGSIHTAVYINNNGNKTTTDRITDIGAAYGTYGIALRANYRPNNNNPGFLTYSLASNSTTNALLYSSTTPFDTKGFIIGTRTDLSSTTFYKNTTKPTPQINYYNPNTNTVTNNTMPNATITIFSMGAANAANSGLGYARTQNAEYSDRQTTMYSIGGGLSDIDVTNYNNLISAFNNSIGRSNY